MPAPQWSFPGSRWWKFDFHTHTPASLDTTAWQTAKETDAKITPEKWLLKYMAAEIDCVAITDHNSGAWVDLLKTAYAKMQAAHAQDPEELPGFRALTLFPGVEISVQGGVHVLALFDPQKTSADIDSLLGAVGYQGTKGDSDGVTSRGISEVLQLILAAGALPIPAHADAAKGLLQCQAETKKSVVDANTLCQALAVKGLLAVEWCDLNRPLPECAEERAAGWARVLGSDCHSFKDPAGPGSRFTWVKMNNPNLEGLRLALLDGNQTALRRSGDIQPSDDKKTLEKTFDPLRVPAHVITKIEIEKARYMGRGTAASIQFSPYFNAVVGGRGTGKSSVVHGLRLATNRASELSQVGGEPLAHFDAFCTISPGRDDQGALQDDTVIRVEWLHEGLALRLVWQGNGQQKVEEQHHGQWQTSASQSVNAARFPLRIFSQGQIAALAGGGRKSLLGIIDEAAKVAPLQQDFDDAKRTFATQQARLRELDGKLAQLPEITRKLAEAERKLAALAQSDHATVLRSYAQAQRQSREVTTLLEQLNQTVSLIAKLPKQMVLDDWSGPYFTEQDSDILAWRKDIDLQLELVRTEILEKAQKLARYAESLPTDARFNQWQARTQAINEAHTVLQQQLAAQGVTDPQAFAHLTQESQQWATQHKALLQMQSDRAALAQQIEAQQALLTQRRQAITQARQGFIESTLAGNANVRMAVVPFGFDAQPIEHQLRKLLGLGNENFAVPIDGLVEKLARTDDDNKLSTVNAFKQSLLNPGEALDGRFRKYLQGQHENPTFRDSILSWYPEDDLRIEYYRDKQWVAISEGSQGQRSAALLAFLLAFGEEPLVLDQPEDDLDNHLIYNLIVQQIRENKLRRQLIIVTHNPNVVVNGDAEWVHVMEFGGGQCFVQQSGSLQESDLRKEVCRVMEGGHEAFARRWKRLGTEL